LPQLSATARARLQDKAFAYVDSTGRRRLPIHDASHVRNALARFDQTAFEDDAARERARERLLRAAKKYGIVPIGFFDGQLRKARAGDVGRLPRGTVTLLFTDIEDSTGLLGRLGDGYAAVLRDVRSLIRASVRRAAGHQVDARGDEFFAVFKRPDQALAAAIEIQRSMRTRPWPPNVTVCVRIGLHSGRPTLADSGYVGIAVNTAARICSAGHGGQILLSAATRELVDGRLEGLALRSLGQYSLTGITEPVGLFQVNAPDLVAKFARLRARRHRAAALRV
jgi:class 3 adenylate cyclase